MNKFTEWLAEKLANDATQIYINKYDEQINEDTIEVLAKTFLEKLHEINESEINLQKRLKEI